MSSTRADRGRDPVVWPGCVCAWLCTSAEWGSRAWQGLLSRRPDLGNRPTPGQRVFAKDRPTDTEVCSSVSGHRSDGLPQIPSRTWMHPSSRDDKRLEPGDLTVCRWRPVAVLAPVTTSRLRTHPPPAVPAVGVVWLPRCRVDAAVCPDDEDVEFVCAAGY